MSVAQLQQIAVAALGDSAPTAQQVLRIAVRLAEEANRFQGLKGRDRLDLVLTALREALRSKTSIPPATLEALMGVVNTVVPEALSLIVDASRGSFSLKKPSVGCVAALAATLCRAVPVAGAAQMAAVADAVAVAAADAKPPSPATPASEVRDPAPVPATSSPAQ